MRSPYFTRPATSVMIGIEYGSHSARSLFASTFSPSRTSRPRSSCSRRRTAASRRAEQSNVENRNPGVVKFVGLNVARKKDGTLIVMNRNGEVVINDEQGRERERYGVVYGARMLVKDGEVLTKGGVALAEWDPYSMPIIT